MPHANLNTIYPPDRLKCTITDARRIRRTNGVFRRSLCVVQCHFVSKHLFLKARVVYQKRVCESPDFAHDFLPFCARSDGRRFPLRQRRDTRAGGGGGGGGGGRRETIDVRRVGRETVRLDVRRETLVAIGPRQARPLPPPTRLASRVTIGSSRVSRLASSLTSHVSRHHRLVSRLTSRVTTGNYHVGMTTITPT